MTAADGGVMWLLGHRLPASFTHTIGKSDPCVTILTIDEFCSRLERLRRRLVTPADKP